MKTLFKQIEDYDVNGFQFSVYNFFIDKLELKWEPFKTVDDFIKAKQLNKIPTGRLPSPGRVVINLTRDKVVSFYYQNRWEYDGLYIGRDLQLLEYVRSKLYFDNTQCTTCGSEGVNTLEKYQAQTRFESYNPQTVEKFAYTKFIAPNFAIKYDIHTDKEIEIKRFYLSLAEAPEEVIGQTTEEFFDTFRFHSVSVFENSGDLFIELYL